MRRMVMTTLLTGVLVCSSGTAVFAGEYNGKGGFVPGGENGRSECSYSGRDVDDDVEGNPPGFDDDWAGADYHGVQSYGQYVSLGLKAFLPSPGHACNPTRGFAE